MKFMKVFDNLKSGKETEILPLYDGTKLIAYMRPLTKKEPDSILRLLYDWRRKYPEVFLDANEITVEGTKKWFKKQVIEAKDRILFLIESDRPIGHMGLFRYDAENRSIEIDNVIRGTDDAPGVMTAALQMLIGWTQYWVKPETIYLQVLPTNTKAIAFYKQNGFKECEVINEEQRLNLRMKYENLN